MDNYHQVYSLCHISLDTGILLFPWKSVGFNHIKRLFWTWECLPFLVNWAVQLFCKHQIACMFRVTLEIAPWYTVVPSNTVILSGSNEDVTEKLPSQFIGNLILCYSSCDILCLWLLFFFLINFSLALNLCFSDPILCSRWDLSYYRWFNVQLQWAEQPF